MLLHVATITCISTLLTLWFVEDEIGMLLQKWLRLEKIDIDSIQYLLHCRVCASVWITLGVSICFLSAISDNWWRVTVFSLFCTRACVIWLVPD
jgi:hypothetical protein